MSSDNDTYNCVIKVRHVRITGLYYFYETYSQLSKLNNSFKAVLIKTWFPSFILSLNVELYEVLMMVVECSILCVLLSHIAYKVLVKKLSS